MKSNNRITYRFDRAGNTISDSSIIKEAKAENTSKAPKEKVIPLYPVYDQHNVNEQSPWNSPFQDDIGALEKLIRDTEAEAAMQEGSAPPGHVKSERQDWSAPNGPVKSGRKGPDTRLDKPADELVTTLKEQVNYEIDTSEQDDSPYILQHAEMDHLPDRQGNDDEWPSHHAFIQEDERAAKTGKLFMEAEERQYRHSSRNRHVQGPSWLNVFLSVAAALATGALFGYLLLSLFTGASLWPADNPADLGAKPASGSIGESVDGTTEATADPKPTDASGQNGAPAAGANVPLTGLDQTYYMLQFGVFSTVEGRDTALAQLNNKGLAAAALVSTDDYRVYAGMASDKSNAEIIRAQMADIDLYIKEVTVQTPESIAYNGAAAEIQSFFDQTKELVHSMDELTLTQLEQTSLSPIGNAAAQAWQTNFGEWTKKADMLRIGIADEKGKAYATKLIQAVQDAAAALQAYNKKPSKSQLWSVQSSLMESILIQKEWFDSISTL